MTVQRDNPRPVVLFATPVLHHPPVGGPELRIENSIKGLVRVCELHVCSRTPKIGGWRARSFYNRLVRRFYFTPRQDVLARGSRFLRRASNRTLSAVGLGEPFFVESPAAAGFDEIVRIAKKIRADVIWLGFGNISYPLLSYVKERTDIPVVVDTDSVWSRFVLRELDCDLTPEAAAEVAERGRAKAEEECWGTRLAEVTTAVSEVDAEYYCGLVGDSDRVCLFSNVIDVAEYSASVACPSNLQAPYLLLAGSFWKNSPMEDAARWTIGRVLPLIRARIPKIHLHIVGRRSDEILVDVQDDAVTVHGEVPSVLPYLKNSLAALVPLRFESGTRFKILEAGACGVPVVSTTLGAEGLPITNGEDILIADTPEDFAEKICELAGDPELAEKLSRNLKLLVEQQFGIDALERQAQKILSQVMPSHRSSATQSGA